MTNWGWYYVLTLICENFSKIYLFDSHNKDENGGLSSSGTAVLLKFETLYSLQSYTISVYYNSYPLTHWLFYFQVQFIKGDCTASKKSVIKHVPRKEQFSARRVGEFTAIKNYHEHREKKIQSAKKRHHYKIEILKQCKKQKYIWKILHQKLHIRKKCIRKILRCNWYIKKQTPWKSRK